MTKHGIFTSTADYWIHLHVWTADLFWYQAEVMRTFIRLNPHLKTKLGHSKDQTATGNGYTIPKNSFFITRQGVSQDVLPCIDWKLLTDRDLSMWGELIVQSLITRRVLRLPDLLVCPDRTREGQNGGRDAVCKWHAPFSYEVKTDCTDTDNIYVQTEEHGHKPTLRRAENGATVEQYSELPPFENG